MAWSLPPPQPSRSWMRTPLRAGRWTSHPFRCRTHVLATSGPVSGQRRERASFYAHSIRSGDPVKNIAIETIKPSSFAKVIVKTRWATNLFLPQCVGGLGGDACNSHGLQTTPHFLGSPWNKHIAPFSGANESNVTQALGWGRVPTTLTPALKLGSVGCAGNREQVSGLEGVAALKKTRSADGRNQPLDGRDL